MTLLEPELAQSEIGLEQGLSTGLICGNSDWAERGEFWHSQIGKSPSKRRKRERNSTPLILCGHGVSIRVEQGTLAIRDGFTHYPQDQVTYRYFPGSRDIPMRILLLDGSGTLSFDVLTWLGEQSVALARVKWTGEIAAVASGSGFASDQAKVRWQHDTRADEAKRIDFAADLIRRKLFRSVETLERHFTDTPLRAVAVAKLSSTADRLASEHFSELNEIRVLEGECAARYFDAWQPLEIRWAGIGRKPIPDDWRQFTMRSSLANGIKPYNRNASHPVNAMLNYAYAVKLAQLQLQAISDGYDPTVGIMHHAREGKPSYALDLIEPERPRVDSAILSLIGSHSLHTADFVLRPDGVCRLSPQLARAVANRAL
jgi:CRISPR-associated protein Cas1